MNVQLKQAIDNLNLDIIQLKQQNSDLKANINDLKVESKSSSDDESDNDSKTNQLNMNITTTKSKSKKKTTSAKLDPNIGKYSGRGDIEHFLFVADSALKVANVHPDDQIMKMIPHFVGGPLQYLKSFVDEGK